MPWRAASPMDQRIQFIADFLRDALSITELCALYGVSRKTGYKWIDRCLRHGPAGLEEQSRRPRRSPHQTSEEIVAAVLEARRRHPTWGGTKLLAPQAPSALAVARPIDGLRHPAAPGDGATTAPASPHRASGEADEPDSRAQRGLERRLQGPVSDRRRLLLLSAHGGRRLQPVSLGLPGAGLDRRRGGQARLHAAVQGVRSAEADADRQRRSLRDEHLGTLVDALGVVGAARHPPRADRAGAAGAERPS